jgi:hypothetical protein
VPSQRGTVLSSGEREKKPIVEAYDNFIVFESLPFQGVNSRQSSTTIMAAFILLTYVSAIYPYHQVFSQGEIATNMTASAPVDNSKSKGGGGTTGSKCLIATAAFGSELSPQVQFLRNFRDYKILSTVSGSSFMNVFNALYYSFSPYVANYEREQPWLQQTVRIGTYPLFGILLTTEKAYSVLPGEYGSILAGMIASALIGVIYLSPIALFLDRGRIKEKFSNKILGGLILTVTIIVPISLLIHDENIIMLTTPIFVLTFCVVSSLICARIVTLYGKKLIFSYKSI